MLKNDRNRIEKRGWAVGGLALEDRLLFWLTSHTEMWSTDDVIIIECDIHAKHMMMSMATCGLECKGRYSLTLS